jgi:hypothetical protein
MGGMGSLVQESKGTGPKYGSGVPCLPLKKRLVLEEVIAVLYSVI